MENNVVVVVTQESGVIKCDFEGAKLYLKNRLEEYQGAVFTEDSKNVAKKVVANLRKEKKAFADRVREVKVEYMAPFTQFEAQAKELIGMYDEPINFINSQVEDFEQKRHAEKQELIQAIYAECIGDMREYLPLEKIYNAKWENVTCRQKEIYEEIVNAVTSVRTSVQTIQGMRSEAEEAALNRFKQDLSLSNAIAYINNYEQQKAAILAKEQERQRREEEERIRREERERIEAERRAQEEKEAALRKAEEEKIAAVEVAKEEAAQEVIDSLISNAEGETSLYEYRMALTADQKEKLEMYLDSVGVEWELM